VNPLFTYLIAIVAGAALIRMLRLLNWPATITAALMAFLLLIAGGWSWLTPALAFLFSASLWTQWPGASRSTDRTRSARQVLANGLVAMIFSLTAIVTSHPALSAAIVGCFAAAAADTWATEWGGKFGGRPVSLRTFRLVQPGQSGAISLVGTLATILGALFIAALAAVVGMIAWEHIFVIGLAGTLGSVFDSIAGAWFQGMWKEADDTFSEQPPGGINLKPYRGFRWVDNDIVNLTATLSGGLLSLWWCVG
jgi:uncharacterized protein (TIGR00297 family)